MPCEHRGGLNLQMANLIYRIGKGIPVDLGGLIFKHVITFRKPATKESKIKLPFPCTIYGVLRTQGFRPEVNEPMEAPQVKLIDPQLKQGSHVLDIFPYHGSSSAPTLDIDQPRTSQLTAQHLDRSIKDLNTIIQILAEKRGVEMQLREELRLREQELTIVAEPSDAPTDENTNAPNPSATATAPTNQEAVSSESE